MKGRIGVAGAVNLLEGIRNRGRPGKTSLRSRVTYVAWVVVCRSAGDQKGCSMFVITGVRRCSRGRGKQTKDLHEHGLRIETEKS